MAKLTTTPTQIWQLNILELDPWQNSSHVHHRGLWQGFGYVNVNLKFQILGGLEHRLHQHPQSLLILTPWI